MVFMYSGVSGIVVEGKKVLLVKRDNSWTLPGGKYSFEKKGDEDCLKQEFYNELGGVCPLLDSYYRTFYWLEENGEKNVSRSYFCKLIGEISFSVGEIRDYGFFDTKKAKELNISGITKKALDFLVKDNLIN